VVGVALLECGGAERSGEGSGDHRVYDIEVADNHNFFAAGVLVSNCDSYKNLSFYTARDNVKGLSRTNSQRASDMLMKTSWLLRRNNGRGVVFSTGTPVANTIAELWTMMRYLMPETLKQMGLAHFDAWANQFATETITLEQTVSGRYQPTTRFAKFLNMPELSKLFQHIADVRMAADLQMPRPRLVGADGEDNDGKRIDIVSTASPELRSFMSDIEQRMRALKGMPVQGGDNMLAISNDARKAALDLRLVDPSAPEPDDSKANNLADQVAKVWRDTTADKGTQLVFLDIGTPKAKEPKEPKTATVKEPVADEDGDPADTDAYVDVQTAEEARLIDQYYELVRRKLIDRGIPREQIAFIQDAKKPAEKSRLMTDVRTGRVRVMIGSTAKMGAGLNVQTRLAALHHMDTPWRPRDIEQREGRAIRQGNVVYGPKIDADGKTTDPGKGVRIFRYVTEVPAFDGYIWQALEAKIRAIKSIMRREVSARRVEDADEIVLSYAEIRALTSGDPEVFRMVELKADVDRLEMLESSHRSSLINARSRASWLPQMIEGSEKELAAFEAAAKDAASAPKTIEISNAKYEDAKDAAAALEEWAARSFDRAPKGENIPVGEYRGFKLLFHKGNELAGVFVLRHSAEATLSTTIFDPVKIEKAGPGWLTRLEHTFAEFTNRPEKARAEIERGKRQLEAAQAGMNQPFEHAAALDEKRHEIARIEAKLTAASVSDVPADIVAWLTPFAPDEQTARQWGTAFVADNMLREFVDLRPAGVLQRATRLVEESKSRAAAEKLVERLRPLSNVLAPEQFQALLDTPAKVHPTSAAESPTAVAAPTVDEAGEILPPTAIDPDKPATRLPTEQQSTHAQDTYIDDLIGIVRTMPNSGDTAWVRMQGGLAIFEWVNGGVTQFSNIIQPSGAATSPPPADAASWPRVREIALEKETPAAPATSPTDAALAVPPTPGAAAPEAAPISEPVAEPSAPAAPTDAAGGTDTSADTNLSGPPTQPEPPGGTPTLPTNAPAPVEPETPTQLTLDDWLGRIKDADSVDALASVWMEFAQPGDNAGLLIDIEDAFLAAYDARLNELRATAPIDKPIVTPAPAPAPTTPATPPTVGPPAAASAPTPAPTTPRPGATAGAAPSPGAPRPAAGAGTPGAAGGGRVPPAKPPAPGPAPGAPTPPPTPPSTPPNPADELLTLMESWKEPELGLGAKMDIAWQGARKAMYDRLDPLKGISDRTGKLSYYEGRAVPGQRAYGEVIVEHYFVPVLRQLGERLMDKFTGYAIAKHDLDIVAEYNRLTAQGVTLRPLRLPNKQQDPQMALDEMQRTTKPADWATIEDVHKKIIALFREHTLDAMLAASPPLIDLETYNLLTTKYPNWISFKKQGFDAGQAFARQMGAAREASMPEQVFHAMNPEGSDRRLKHPIIESLMQIPTTYARVQRNKAAILLRDGLLQMEKQDAADAKALGLPKPEPLVEVGHFYRDPVTNEWRSTLKSGVPDRNDEEWGTIDLIEPTKSDPSKVARYIVRLPRFLADSANSADAEPMGRTMQHLGAVSQFFRNTMTTWNPGFALVNIPRDQFESHFRGGVSPFRREDWPHIMRGLAGAISHNQDYIDAASQSMFMSGFTQVPKTAGEFNQMLADRRVAGAIPVRNIGDVALVLPRLIALYGQRTEEATRIANYLARVKPNLGGPLDAVWRVKGREYTIDFGKSGNVARYINYFLPMFNAGLHASANLYRTFRGDHDAGTIRRRPGAAIPPPTILEMRRGRDGRYYYPRDNRAMQRALLALAPMVGISVLSFLWNKLFDDDLRQEIPEWVHRSSWPFLIGSGWEYDPRTNEVKRIPYYIPIYKPPIANFATALPEQLMKYAWDRGDRTLADRLMMAAGQMLQVASPIEPGPGGILPPPFKQAIELWANKTFYDQREIRPPRMMENLPEDQYDQNTSWQAIGLTNGVLSPVSRKLFGAGISPMAVDHLFRMTGGLNTVTTGLDFALGLMLGPNKDQFGSAFEPEKSTLQRLGQTPVLNRLIGARAGGESERGYDKLNRVLTEVRAEAAKDPELRRLGIRVAQVGDTITVPNSRISITIKPDERADYQRLAWDQSRDYLDRLYGSGLYQGQPDQKQTSLIESTQRIAHQEAGKQFLLQLGYDVVRERMMAKQQAG
jgi:hypothetical protein